MEKKVALLLLILISTATIGVGVSYMLVNKKQGLNNDSEQSVEGKTKNLFCS
jgi:hypothetical protein